MGSSIRVPLTTSPRFSLEFLLRIGQVSISLCSDSQSAKNGSSLLYGGDWLSIPSLVDIQEPR